MTAESSILLTTRDDLSLLYRVLRLLIRPLRPRLVGFGDPLPAGSPKLSPPNTKCTIQERQVEDIYLYNFVAESPKPDLTETRRQSNLHQLYYFAGGGFQAPPSSDHWKFVTELCIRLKDTYSVTLVSYPLAPHTSSSESLPLLRNWLRSAISDAALKGSSVTLMGDSSGGNIALSLGLWWAANASNQSVRSTLKNVFALSPPTDLRNKNPEIIEADKHDPILTLKLTTDVGKLWAGATALDNPDISPLFADINTLREAGIKVHGLVGTFDCLAPDATKFREACSQAGISGEWLEWKGQMHCFPLAFHYGMREAKEGKDWCVDVLRRNA